MIEFYPQIKSVHIAAVVLSGLLFRLASSVLLDERRRSRTVCVYRMRRPAVASRLMSVSSYSVVIFSKLLLSSSPSLRMQGPVS
jgi:hypothetical protein